ncbi:hypothetical protein So717_17360 [Roseobacter cerasinus]|uniref:Uncharacterized protein n=1 Tax=Roseobacter cerasinus TaxID=2602289 RepID=A0A640VP30_9RHOB|nr:hypothetical protein [Roseobacter cerasinus]GFE49983.1 hypothetical protein So717_17360 [Roseobacter cerasinus]
MQLVFHTGAHFTEEERLLRCLLKNKAMLSAKSVAVPGPGKYRRLLQDTIRALQANAPAENARDVLLDVILDDATADRVVLSDGDFFGPHKDALGRGVLYPAADTSLRQMQRVFDADEIELFMAVKNPASFLPALRQQVGQGAFESMMQGDDLEQLKWSEVFIRILQAVPGIAITVWCSEDAPLIWSEVMREIGQVTDAEEIQGAHELLSDIMAPEGMAALEGFLERNPDAAEVHRRRAMIACLEEFALQDAIEEELDMPGWTAAYVDDLTAAYDADVDKIARLPGVRVILP